MIRKYAVIATITLIDIITSFFLFSKGKEFRYNFVLNTYYFDITKSVLELWIFSLVRFSLTTGFVLGILKNHDKQEGCNRLKKFFPLVLLLAVCMWSYTLIKLLLRFENPNVEVNDLFFWSLFAWSLVMAIVFYIEWKLLCSTFNFAKKKNLINESDYERAPLLANDDEDEEVENNLAKENAKRNLFRMLTISAPDWPILLIAFTFLTLCSLGQIFTPYYTGLVIQSIAIQRDHKKFVSSILLMSAFSIGSAIAGGIRGGCFRLAISRFNLRVRRKLFASIVQQEIGFFDNSRTGDITSRLTSDTTTMSDALSLNTNIFLRNLIEAVGICVFMFKLSWRLSLVTFIGLPIVIGFSKVYGQYFQQLSKKVQDMFAKANEVAEETTSTMRTIRSFANEIAEAKRYSDKLDETYALKKREAFVYATYMMSVQMFSFLLSVSSLYYGGKLVMDNFINGGTLISFILYQVNLGHAIESIGSVYTGLMQAIGASHKVFQYMDRKPDIQPCDNHAPENLDGKIEFRNVSFSYPTRIDSPVLKEVSFTINPGEVVALVGPSGGGKSSCINLLQHFYDTLSGQVLIDGLPVHKYDHHYYHRKVALVGQEPVLYARSIKENIAYGLTDCNDEDIKVAANMANAHKFIMELNDGYDTQSGEKGIQLSGGQKQRIAIARAIVRHPSILLLDEATSALDSESEHAVQQAIYRNLTGRTVILIAHRLSTVERADRIIVIDKGEVMQQGSHQELLKDKKGLYARLVQRQLLRGTEHGEQNKNDQHPKSTRSMPCTQTYGVDDTSEHTKPNIGSYGSINTGSIGVSPIGSYHSNAAIV